MSKKFWKGWFLALVGTMMLSFVISFSATMSVGGDENPVIAGFNWALGGGAIYLIISLLFYALNEMLDEL